MELLGCLMFINTVISTGLSPRSIQNAGIKTWKRHTIVSKIATSITKPGYESKKSYGLIIYKRKRFVEILKSLFDNKFFTCEGILNKFSALKPAGSILKQNLTLPRYSKLSLPLNTFKKIEFPDTIDYKNSRFYELFYLEALGVYNEKHSPHPYFISKFQRLMQGITRNIILGRLLITKFDKPHCQISDITSEITKELKMLALEIESKFHIETLYQKIFWLSILQLDFSR